MRGYFGIGIENMKTGSNLGTLWRSASILGAAFIFVIGRRYSHQCSDTVKAWKHIPLYHYDTFSEFHKSLPKACRLVGLELLPESIPVTLFTHPERCIYLLGAEDNGLSSEAIDKCHHTVRLPGVYCLNVSVAGSIIMYDRLSKGHT